MNEKQVQRVLYFVALIGTLIFILAPVFFMVFMSLSDKPDFLGNSFVFTTRHFREILTIQSLHFPRYCLNSIIISAISAGVCTLFAGLGAYTVTRFQFPGRIGLLVAILTLSMFPQISIVGYLFRLIAGAGLINTYMGLILPYTAWIPALV